MLTQVVAGCGHLPDVWGEGALFAYSGLDGPTNSASGWVGSLGRRPYDLLFHTPHRRQVGIALQGEGRPRVCTGDLLWVQSASGDLLLAYSAWHTLTGVLPPGARVDLRMEAGPSAHEHDGVWLASDAEHADAVVLARAGERVALAYGRTLREAEERARSGLRQDALAVAAQRLAPYRTLPRLAAARWDRLLRKAVSVLRVNILAAEGTVAQAWATPDRVPHRDRWLWDTVFQSFALNALAPRVSWETIRSVLDAQRPDGRIAHQMSVNGSVSSITQPPVLAWGVWENYGALQDRNALAYALPRLERYLAWDVAHRDLNGNGLLEWHLDGDERCRSGESGMDNSPRFDDGGPADAVDFSAFAAHDMGCLACIAETLGDEVTAARWRERARVMSSRVHGLLWDEGARFYGDRDMEGGVSPVRAVSGFTPLLLDDIPADHIDGLVAALHDPSQFDTPFPVASLAVSHPAWCTDMWRGATWLNYNYCIIEGLERHGRANEAQRLIKISLDQLERYYCEHGVLFEFYDAQDRVSPVACARKGPRQEPYDIRCKVDSIRDYGWTAAAAACWLLRYRERVAAHDGTRTDGERSVIE